MTWYSLILNSYIIISNSSQMVGKEESMLSLSKYAAAKKRNIRIGLTLRRAQDDRLCYSVEIVLTKSEHLQL